MCLASGHGVPVAAFRFDRHDRSMRFPLPRRLALFLTFAAISQISAAGSRPRPAPVRPPEIVDPSSDKFKAKMAASLKAERQIALRTGPVVTRRFLLSWEMHYGFKLIPASNTDEIISPDFADQGVLQQFIDFDQPGRIFPVGIYPPNLGKRTFCECTGVEWSFSSDKRFIVQSAKLTAE